MSCKSRNLVLNLISTKLVHFGIHIECEVVQRNFGVVKSGTMNSLSD